MDISPGIRTELYPAIEPYSAGMLPLDRLHTMYWEQSGNPAGVPALFLHGGPGAGSAPNHRRFFDPERYRIVIYDQRGAGRSTPLGELRDNTTPHLIEDIEKLRRHLGIEQWLVFGGSWGSTLALAYAQTHTECVSELVVRGIFTVRREELLWYYQEGASWLFPDEWEHFVAPIPLEERHDLMAAYHRLLTGPDEKARLQAAVAWSRWEGRTITLLPDAGVDEVHSDPHYALAFSRIENHSFVNNGFLEDQQLLRDAGKLRGIPGVIVQGRYDIATPAKTAWELHRAWPEAEFHLVTDAGHAFKEPGILDLLVRATDMFAGF